jgi:zinc transporter ZupT
MSTAKIGATTVEDHKECEHEDLMTPRIIICIVLLLVGLFVYLPFTERFKHTPGKKISKGKSLFYSVMACFAAGMLLSIAMVHIMPESTALYEAYLEHAGETAAVHDAHDDEECEEEDEHDDHEAEAAAAAAAAATTTTTATTTAADTDHEGEEDHDEHEGEEEAHGFPLPQTLFVVGFIIMLTMDQVIFKKSDKILRKIASQHQDETSNKNKSAGQAEGGSNDRNGANANS